MYSQWIAPRTARRGDWLADAIESTATEVATGDARVVDTELAAHRRGWLTKGVARAQTEQYSRLNHLRSRSFCKRNRFLAGNNSWAAVGLSRLGRIFIARRSPPGAGVVCAHKRIHAWLHAYNRTVRRLLAPETLDGSPAGNRVKKSQGWLFLRPSRLLVLARSVCL